MGKSETVKTGVAFYEAGAWGDAGPQIHDLVKRGRSDLPPFNLDGARLIPITENNIGTLHELIDSQAEAHNTVVRGKREKTVKALLHPKKKKRILDGFILESHEGKPAGFVTTSISHTSEGRVMYLEDIHTLPGYQKGPDGKGRKVGSTMYRAVQFLAWANGCHAVPCTVDDGNESAKGFYQAMGAQKHEHPVLGMDGFTTLSSAKELGSVVVISAEDRAKTGT